MNLFFKDFSEYWHYTKSLTDKQRKVLHSSLPEKQRKQLEKSYKEGGWEDLFLRNRVDVLLDEILKEHDFDLLSIKIMVIKGKKIYVKKDFWNQIILKFKGIGGKHIHHVFSGYEAIDSENADEYQLVKTREK